MFFAYIFQDRVTLFVPIVSPVDSFYRRSSIGVGVAGVVRDPAGQRDLGNVHEPVLNVDDLPRAGHHAEYCQVIGEGIGDRLPSLHLRSQVGRLDHLLPESFFFLDPLGGRPAAAPAAPHEFAH